MMSTTRKDLENKLNSMTPEEAAAAIADGNLNIDSDKYVVMGYSETGKYGVNFTENYMESLHRICEAQGMEDRLDEMVQSGYDLKKISSEYIDYNDSLSKTGEIPQVLVYEFQNEQGEEEKLIVDNGQYVDVSYDDAKGWFKILLQDAEPQIKNAMEFAEKTGFDQGICMKMMMELNPEITDMDAFAAEYKQAVQDSLKNIAGSTLWDRYRSAEGAETDPKHRERNLKEMLSATALKKEEALKEILGTESTVLQAFGENAFRDAGKADAITKMTMALVGDELDKHLDSIESYRDLVNSLPYENIELIVEMTGREDPVMQLIAEQGSPEDMKKYLTQTIPSDRIPEEELQTEGSYFYRTCSDHIAEMVWLEASIITQEEFYTTPEEREKFDFKGCDRKTLMSVLGGIEHDEQLTDQQKEALSRAYLQAQFSGNKDNRFLNNLLHMNVDQKFERSMDMVFSDLADQAKIMKEVIAEKYQEIMSRVLESPQVQDARSYLSEMTDRLKEENLPDRIRYIITGEEKSGEKTEKEEAGESLEEEQKDKPQKKMDMQFRFKNIGDVDIPIPHDAVKKFMDWSDQAREKAKNWLNSIAADPNAQKNGIHKTSADGTMTADTQKKLDKESPDRVTVEYEQVAEEKGSNKARVNMSQEQILTLNAGRLGQEIKEGLEKEHDYLTVSFREKGSVYTAIPAVKEGPDNPDLNVTGVVLAVTSQDKEGKNVTWLLPDTYQDIDGLEDSSREQRIYEIERNIPDTVLGLSFEEESIHQAAMEGKEQAIFTGRTFAAIKENGDAVAQMYITNLDLESNKITVSIMNTEGDLEDTREVADSLKLINLRSQQAISEEELLSMNGMSGEQIFDRIDALGIENISAKTVAEVLQESFGDEMYENSSVTRLIEEMDEFAQANGFGENVMHDLIKDYADERTVHEAADVHDTEEPDFDDYDTQDL